jgi:hypothetical protein
MSATAVKFTEDELRILVYVLRTALDDDILGKDERTGRRLIRRLGNRLRDREDERRAAEEAEREVKRLDRINAWTS